LDEGSGELELQYRKRAKMPRQVAASSLMIGVPWVYKLHVLLGFTIFLISPFTRMIHIWSGAGALAYLFRPYQIVRTPRTRARVPVLS
jgi:nitrate reductase gamma subunit